MHRYSSAFLSVLVTLGLLLTGCDATGGSSGARGSLELRMSGASTSQTATRTVSTDMPATPTASDVDTALVTIDQVSVVPAEDTSDGDSTETGVQVLSDSNFTVDLKDLQAGLDTSVAEMDVPAGTYGQVRLVTAGRAQVSFVDTEGTQPVMIASGQQSGLKVNVESFTIEGADDRVELTLNWNVEQALHGAPQGRYVITPAIDASASVTTIDN